MNLCDKIYFPRSVSACNFCTAINLFMCASFRVFSLNFEGDKLSPWPFFKGTIPIAVRDWRNGAAWLKPCILSCFAFIIEKNVPNRINKASLPPNLYQLPSTIFSNLVDHTILCRASDRLRKKSQISWDF